MEAEATPTTGTEAGAGTGIVADYDAVLSGASPESVVEQAHPAQTTPETSGEPAETTREVKEPEAEPAEAETRSEDQTAEQDAEPLPQKIEDLLKAVRQANPKLAQELNKIVREDHFLLHGPDGYLQLMPTIEEAREYKSIAPTVEDLRVMADYAQRYDGMDRQYTNDPEGLIRTLAEDQEAFSGVVRAFEPALRAFPQLYAQAAQAFIPNFWRNVIADVEQIGTPDEIETFKAYGQKRLGYQLASQAQQSQSVSQFQNTPEWRELQQLREERAARQGQNVHGFFQEVDREATTTLRGEVRKYLDEKAGAGLPEDIRDEMAQSISRQIFGEINGNPIVASELNRLIEGGDLSMAHKQAVIERVMQRAKAYLPTKSAPEIRRWSDRLRKLQGGNSNASKPTTNKASKDVGSGSPTVGQATGAPKGFPPGWNAMDPERRAAALAPLVNWRQTDEENFSAVCAGYGDPSKVVLKGA